MNAIPLKVDPTRIMIEHAGKLITFSGLDGAGKSTQIELLIRAFRAQGSEPKLLWSRVGYTTGFNFVKSLARKLLGRGGALPPSGHSEQRTQMFRSPAVRWVWTMIALLDMTLVYGVQLRWWRARRKIVICDRYLWDSLVDLEVNHGNSAAGRTLFWKMLAITTPRPDAAFCFLIPVEESLRRSDIKGEPFRDPPEVLLQRLERYHELRKIAGWIVVDGRGDREEIARRIMAVCEGKT